VFHRVDDPMALPSSRFFRMAERLHLRGGAVTAARASSRTVEREEWSPPPAPVIAEGTASDIAALAAMSQHPGFPGIGYSGG
jgi:hypothetical protein